MIFAFLSNILEPFAYLIFFIAVYLQLVKTGASSLRLLLFHYLVCTLLMTLAAWKAFYSQDNLWTYNVLWLQSAFFIPLYFHQRFRSRRKKWVIRALISINLLYFLINDIVYAQLFRFDSLGYSLLSVSISIVCFMYFYQVFTHVTEKPIWYDFNFWLVSGYLFYFLVSFAIFLTYHQLTSNILDTYTSEERHLLTVLWGVHNCLLFISAVTALFGHLWITYRNR
jgi:hypothetical protein